MTSTLTLLQHEVCDEVKEDLFQMADTLHGAPNLLWTSLPHRNTSGKLLPRSVLLGEEERHSHEDGTGREEPHQDSIRLK